MRSTMSTQKQNSARGRHSYIYCRGRALPCKVEGRKAVHPGGSLLEQHLELLREGEQCNKHGPEAGEEQLEKQQPCIGAACQDVNVQTTTNQRIQAVAKEFAEVNWQKKSVGCWQNKEF